MNRPIFSALLLALTSFALLATPGLAQQVGTVTGVVVDQATGDPVNGAQVVLEDTGIGTVTNEQGGFVLEDVPAGTYNLVVTFLGRAEVRRTNLEVGAGETVQLDLSMRERALRLEGVVATGVVDPIEGVRIPFSVGRLTAEDLPVPTTHSALAAIQGKVAGVSINRVSGQPGTGVSILLRSPTSIIRNNSPLYVVDGVILGTTFGGTTLDIEAMDIESVEVVKGAAAAALYGSRAAGGVINITTNRGQGLDLDQTMIRARSEIGYSELPRGVPLAEHHHYEINEQGQFVREDGGIAETIGERILASDRMMDKPYAVQTYDNIQRFFQPGLFVTNQASLGHNSANTNFFLTFNNWIERGSIVTNSGYERRNFRINLDHRLTQDLTLQATAYHNRSYRDNLSGSPFWNLLMYEPTIDLSQTDDQGNYLATPDPTSARENPIWRQTTRDNNTRRSRTLLSGNVDFRPLSWFRVDGNFSYDRADIHRQIYVPKGVEIAGADDDDPGTDGRLDLQETIADVLNGSISTHFIRQFGDLNFRTTLRGIMEQEKRTIFRSDSRDFWVRDVPRMDVGQDQRTHSSYVEIQSLGYLSQFGMDYDGRYIGDFLVRRDGSSLFGPGNRWHTYYRASAAWRMAQESWWPLGLDFLTEFKPRASFGTAGGRPSFSDQYETWSVGSDGSVSKGTLGNRNLGPENTTEIETGLDFVVNDRYSVEISYVHQETSDQIIQIPQPAVTGYSNQMQNAGTITGTTWEATIQALVMQRPNFNWNSTLVFDRTTSVITEWERVCYLVTLTIRCLDANRSEVWGDRFLEGGFDDLPEWHRGSESAWDINDDGYLVPVGEGNTWRSGLWGTTVEIDGHTYDWGMPVLDVDEDGGTIVQRIGEGFPDFQLGWINQMRWHGFHVHTHFHAQVGGEAYNRTKQRLYQHFRHADLDQAGKPDDEKKPIDYYQILYNTNNVSSPFVEDASFLKLRELAVRYTFGSEQLGSFGLDRLGLDRMTLGVIGRNLFTITPYSGYDPEVGSVMVRHDNFSWPNVRNYTFNLELVF